MDEGNDHTRPESDENPPGARAKSDEAGAPRSLAFEDRYLLGEELARGGMGRVMAALDRSIGREVAIKESLTHNSARSTVRFVRESLMTARLQHPSIIPVYEVGRRATGEPYLVMRLVHGKPLATLIEATESLPARLALLPSALAAIDAMAYAHNRGIIHRDLKPSNILVGEFGETVLIDWGLAKDLNAPHDPLEPQLPGSSISAELTIDGAIIGTPTYMAPEQASGLPADKRSDVYALGAVLYELFSGRMPFNLSATIDVLDQVISREPVPLEDQVPELPGDLVSIVKTAMHRDPSMRFQSAAQLADELRRFQSGQLVSAHRYSTGELMLRWARKYRVLLAAVFLSLVVIGVVATLSIRQVLAERDRASQQAEAATRVSDFLTGMFKTNAPGEARGNNLSARDLLDRAKKQIDDDLAKEPEVQSHLMMVMGDVYSDLGLYPEAEQLLKKSLAISIRTLGLHSPQTLSAKNALAILYYQQSRYPEAEKLMRELVDERVHSLGEDARETIGAKGNLANLLDDTGRYEESAKLAKDGFDRRLRLFGEDDPETLVAAGNLVSLYAHEERFDLAIAQARQALDTDRRVLGADHPSTMMVADLLALAYESNAQLEDAEGILHKNIAIETRVLGAEHPQTLAAQNQLASVYIEEGRHAEAEKLLRAVWETGKRVEGAGQIDVLNIESNLAQALVGQRRFAEAEPLLREVREKKIALFGAGNPEALGAGALLEKLLLAEGKLADAEALAEKTLAGNRALGSDRHDTAVALENLAAVRIAKGDLPGALELLQQAIPHLRKSELRSLATEVALQPEASDPRVQALFANARTRADQLDHPAVGETQK